MSYLLRLFCLLFILTTGCLPTASKKVNISNSSDRIEMLGVSILPPQEKGWSYEKITDGQIEFSKLINKEETFIIQVSLSRIPRFKSQDEFMKFLSEQRMRNDGDPRFETLINDEVFSEEKGVPSLRFHTKYKDKASPHLPKGEEAFILDEFGIFCITLKVEELCQQI